MSKFGGIQDKIKVINVIKNFLDIQTANETEIDIKFQDHPSKNEFILISKKLQRIPFVYESINRDLSNTILLRQLLYNPAIYPIVVFKKTCKTSDCIYTRTPLKKNILTTQFNLLSVPSEESIYVTGLAIDTTKQGSIFIDNKKSSNIVPEYLDYFDTHETLKIIYFNEINVNDILISLIRQIRYSVRFYNSTIYSYTFEEFNNKNIFIEYIPKNDLINIESWYSKKEIENIKFLLNNKREWIYNLDPLQSLGNDVNQLLFINTEGPKSNKIKEYFVLIEMEKNKMRELQRVEKEKLKSVNMARQYISIIGKKLGSIIQNKILLSLSRGKYLRLPGGSMAIPTINAVNVIDPVAILNYLTKEQQSIIKLEYDKQEKYTKAYYSNKCAHLKIYTALIKSRHMNDTKLLIQDIKKFFKQDLINGYYICELCDFHIICSHVYDRYNYLIDNLPLGLINTNLLNYAVKVKVNKGHEYYCKYCGEQLVKDIYIDDDYKIKSKVILSENEIEIRNYTWSVILTAIKSAGLFNERALAIYISNTIRPFIEEKSMNKFDENTKLNCIMFTYAFLLIIIKEHKISFLGIDPSSMSSKIAEKMLLFIYSKYNTLMKSININTDVLKNEFTAAYKKIINIGPISVPVSNPELNLANFILNIDPIYKYARTICRLFKKIPFKINESPQYLKKEFELILGNSLPEIIKSAKDNIRNPIFADVLNKRFGSVLQSENLEFFYKHPSLNIHTNLISIDNENEILKKFLAGDYNYYLFSSYIMFCKYTKNIHNIDEYEEYRKLLSIFKNVETDMLQTIRKYNQKPIILFKFLKSSHFVKQNVDITTLYDENGNKHKWNIYYYGNNSFNLVPNTKLEPLTDIGCSICGIKKSQLSTLDIEKTNKSVQAISDINSFYMFYKVRCPINEIHDWINNVCTKCNITVEMIDSINSNKITSNILEYYTRYLKQFNKEKKNSKPELVIIKEKEIKLDILITTKWSPSYTPIVKVSQITKYNTNIIESIGLTEGRTYNDVQEGINIPEINIQHIYSAYAELIFAISRYAEWSLQFNGPGIIDYTNLFDRLLYELSYQEIHKFIIQSICEIFLTIIDNNSEKNYAINLFTTIINNQKLLSIPVSSYVYDDSDDPGVYLGDDIGDSGEDLIVLQKLEDNYYSLSNMDYNFMENNEPNGKDKDNEYIYW